MYNIKNNNIVMWIEWGNIADTKTEIETGLTNSSEREWVLESVKKELEWVSEELRNDQDVIQNIAYLTTLARLWENSDLDELFDSDVWLWEEELFTIHALIEIINWKNSISSLKAPKTMRLDTEKSLWKEFSYEIEYEETFYNEWVQINDKSLADMSEVEKWKLQKVSKLKSVYANGDLVWDQSKIIFEYDDDWDVGNIKFERPRSFDQEISIERNEEKQAQKMVVGRPGPNKDNVITISYGAEGLPNTVKQTKLGLSEDEMNLGYDENQDLSTITYSPTLSLKALRKAWKKVNNAAKAWRVAEWIQEASKDLFFDQARRNNSSDIADVKREDWKIVWTDSKLAVSNLWPFQDWSSDMKYSETGELQEMRLKLERPFLWDPETVIKLEY